MPGIEGNKSEIQEARAGLKTAGGQYSSGKKRYTIKKPKIYSVGIFKIMTVIIKKYGRIIWGANF